MASKKVYLVDTENVGTVWKELLPAKSGTDQILLFYTENSPYISYSDLQAIIQYPNTFEMIKCNTGKNGLDFQLVSYLGYLLKTASKTNYIIVSNDFGFDSVAKFWQERGMSVSRKNSSALLTSDEPEQKETVTPSEKTTRKRRSVKISSPKKEMGEPADPASMIEKYLPAEYSEESGTLAAVSDIILGVDTTNHQLVHRTLVKKFGDEKGTVLYKAFRPHLGELRA